MQPTTKNSDVFHVGDREFTIKESSIVNKNPIPETQTPIQTEKTDVNNEQNIATEQYSNTEQYRNYRNYRNFCNNVSFGLARNTIVPPISKETKVSKQVTGVNVIKNGDTPSDAQLVEIDAVYNTLTRSMRSNPEILVNIRNFNKSPSRAQNVKNLSRKFEKELPEGVRAFFNRITRTIIKTLQLRYESLSSVDKIESVDEIEIDNILTFVAKSALQPKIIGCADQLNRIFPPYLKKLVVTEPKSAHIHCLDEFIYELNDLSENDLCSFITVLLTEEKKVENQIKYLFGESCPKIIRISVDFIQTANKTDCENREKLKQEYLGIVRDLLRSKNSIYTDSNLDKLIAIAGLNADSSNESRPESIVPQISKETKYSKQETKVNEIKNKDTLSNNPEEKIAESIWDDVLNQKFEKDVWRFIDDYGVQQIKNLSRNLSRQFEKELTKEVRTLFNKLTHLGILTLKRNLKILASLDVADIDNILTFVVKSTLLPKIEDIADKVNMISPLYLKNLVVAESKSAYIHCLDELRDELNDLSQDDLLKLMTVLLTDENEVGGQMAVFGESCPESIRNIVNFQQQTENENDLDRLLNECQERITKLTL